MAIRSTVPPWLGLQAAALAVSLAHTFVDAHIGLFGPTSRDMTPLQAGTVLATCLVFGWWGVCLGTSTAGTRPGLGGAFALAVGWASLANGAVTVVAAPPPSAAFPYQDITHFGSLALGALAAWATWREMRGTGTAAHRPFVGIAVGLALAAFVLQGVLALTITG